MMILGRATTYRPVRPPDAKGGFLARALAAAALLICLQPAGGAMPLDINAPYADAYRAGNYAEAITLIEKAMSEELGLPPATWTADYAELLQIVGRYDEALTSMSEVVRRVYEPVFTVRLAEMYQENGKDDDARGALELAIRQSQMRFRQEYPRENLIAIGRIARLQGENPRRILQIFQERLLSRFPEFAPGFEAAGEVALEGYGYDLAEKYFLAALTLDETRQDALAGLAATYFQSGDPRFDEVRLRLEAMNPNHPRLRCMRIERLLTAGDAEGAAAEIEKLLAINPLHHEGLAYLAAAAFFDNDIEQQEATLAKLGEIRPGSAEGYRIVGDLAARRYRFSESVKLLREGLALDPGDLQAKASLGLNLLRLGEDATGRVLLEEVFEEDKFNVQVYNTLEVMDSLDHFKTVANADLSIQLPELEAAVMGDELLSFTGEALARYEAEYSASIKRPVVIQMFDDHDEFMVRSIGLPGNAGHLGICFGNLVTLDSPRARTPRTMNWRAVLWHEFVHVITLQKTNNRIPRWLSEGISVYEEGQRDPAWGQPLDPDFQPLLTPGSWPGMESLESYFVRPETPTHLMLGYFLAGEFVEAYVGAYGKTSLVAALDSIGTGIPAEQALLTAAGVDSGALNEVFSAQLEITCAPFLYLGPATDGGVLADVARQNSAFAQAMEAALAARDSGDTTAALEHFEAAAAMYPGLTGKSSPLAQLAAIRAESGDLTAWTSAVKRLQASDATAYDASRELLDALVKNSDWVAVLEQSAWCLGVDPFDIGVHRARQNAETALGDHVSLIHTLDCLAALDSEQADVYRLAKARTFLQLARPDEARRILLTLLEVYPEYREAQQVLLELHDSEKEVHGEDS